MSLPIIKTSDFTKTVFSAVIAFGLFVIGGTSVAQSGSTSQAPADIGFSINLFTPAPGPMNFFSVESPEIGRNMSPTAGLLVSYQHRPFVLLDCTNGGNCTDGPNTINAVNNLLSFDLLGSFNFLKFLQVGLGFPMSYIRGQGFIIDQYSSNPGAIPGKDYATFVINDIRIHVKARVVGKEGADGPALAVALIPTIPLAGLTGMGQSNDTEDNGAYGYGGDGFMTVVAPKVIFGYRFGPFRSSVNLGALWRQKSEMLSAEVGHSLLYGGAVGYTIVPAIEVLAELYGTKSLTGANFSDAEGAPLLFLAGARAFWGDFMFSLAGGGGIISGVGVPQFQIVGGVTWVPKPSGPKAEEFVVSESDLDGDGFENEDDKCPDAPEDRDGFEDEDGCPDTDNDQDGVADGYDSCPMVPEDKDNFRDDDGCPDLDHDEDGIKEDVDKCPNKAEDFDDFEDADGCPEVDNDKDGLEDGTDYCPNDAEDLDGYQDKDGCPELDDDIDGVPDASDKCPDEKENLNGIRDKDGCPDGGRTLLRVTHHKIELNDVIAFKAGTDKIKGDISFAILDIISQIIGSNRSIRLSIQGYTDNRGDTAMNRDLSKRRAEAVKRYIVRKGVSDSRLDTMGFGPDNPIADNKTYEGRLANRRVEFIIIRKHQPDLSVDEEPHGDEEDDGTMDFTMEEEPAEEPAEESNEETEEMDFTAE